MIYCSKCGKISHKVLNYKPTYEEWLSQKEEWEDDLEYYRYQIIWNPVCPHCRAKAYDNIQRLYKCFECGEWCIDGAIGINGLWFCDKCKANNAPRKYVNGEAWERMHKLRCDFIKSGYEEDVAEIMAYTLLQGNIDKALETKQYPDEWPYSMTYNQYSVYQAHLDLYGVARETEDSMQKLYCGKYLSTEEAKQEFLKLGYTDEEAMACANQIHIYN